MRLAAECAAGTRLLPRRNWNALGAAQEQALRAFHERDDVRKILSTPPPDAHEASDLRAARTAAGRDAIRAMMFGYEHGFAAGLENDARAFGTVTASPGGQEWIRRFFAKDPAQASFRTLLDRSAAAENAVETLVPPRSSGDR